MIPIYVALDVPDAARAHALVSRLGPELDRVKVGLELFTREGPALVRELRERGLGVFLDLKLHDIPQTVASAVKAAAALDVELLTVHAAGGRRMLEAAVAAASAEDPAEEASSRDHPHPGRLRLLAVTVLTSLSGAEVGEAWGRTPAPDPLQEVLRLARMAMAAGVDGVVASPREAGALRQALGPRAAVVTPGVRFAGGEAHDQVRIATPEEAARSGASHLVVGRAVTGASDPAQALARLRAEVAQGLARGNRGDAGSPEGAAALSEAPRPAPAGVAAPRGDA
jgi:orotidine-5'-phosphate decarboxylase